ncbi:hypothetical protein [Oceanicoccus sp. KOV_DT_Chl]|uniref:hypothetical protein n=1 Tax=Oceanicoccus sp. KOV_DT_Chl TaxID=1904639 RepID=UPI000C7C259A|nr:hypothetical protein [Oceanicoccus sp. KOV_DT_Chl]
MKNLWSNNPIHSSYSHQSSIDVAVYHLSILEDNVPGNSTIIRDKKNSLDWLNLRATAGKSYAQVRQLCQPGGELQGWCYASLIEAQHLFSQLGFDLDCAATSTLTPNIKDAIKTMNSYLGETIHWSDAFPNAQYSGSIALTGTKDQKDQLITLPAFYEKNSANCTLDISGSFSLGSQYSPPYLSSLLVRCTPNRH